MTYSMDMSEEKKPNIKKILQEGWREFQIFSCEEQKSKSGNDMFKIGIKDVATDYEEFIYAISTKGKRWFLKQILSVCGIEAGQDGVYEWDKENIIGKNFMGLVIHEPNSYINRDGQEIKGIQHKISEVKECEIVAWDENK